MIWQYHCETFDLEEIKAALNAAGKNGWELVSASPVPIGGGIINGPPPRLGMLCILKRPGGSRDRDRTG
ncbi:MAG: DUF4177 domain-containing protein [Patescibacteria group bacterium]|nr:DUF4177 domain-containing protein [Patescibacteria group bacterium]